MNLSLGFSTCPNDTFIFDAMVNGRIDTEGVRFKLHLADVEELNRMAFNSSIDITKVSYHAFAYLSENYQLLTSGSALGYGNGPLLISRHKIYPDELRDLKIAIPGKYTTANLLLSLAYPHLKNKTEYLFSDIEEVVRSGEADAGVIIHENRFTYQSKGLKKIVDLGEYWEQQNGLPIPLGGIIVRRSLPQEIRLTINRVLRRSVEYAFQNPDDSLPFVRKNAQSMDETVMRKHIQLYVNDFSLDLGPKGMEAITTLYGKSIEKGLFPPLQSSWIVA
ncbi:MAG TPA: 1,4-dihydroxy-6-naphthoate synthase [Prolixibacteraceae bacterium]|nr:1,4-dihydroxy-6-naphthoate synthase [Prolixibacteraceae bacterium]